jgi:hypothetical protein
MDNRARATDIFDISYKTSFGVPIAYDFLPRRASFRLPPTRAQTQAVPPALITLLSTYVSTKPATR